jgi:2-polyprenyl-6-methoxyphenol hydroxylase-like FAD-dependent oxidoreductase
LALAVGWRQVHGQSPLLCEQKVARIQQGFGFLLLPRGLQALAALGVDIDRELEPLSIDHARLVTPQNETIAEHRLEPGTLALDRSRLLAALRSRLDQTQILEGRRFETLRRCAAGRVVAVGFRGGEEIGADLVFGADGAVSRCRRALLQHPGEPWMPGTVARVQEIVAQVSAPALAARLGNGMLKIVEPGAGLAVGLLPLARGRLVWFVQFDTVRHGWPHAAGPLPFLADLLRRFPPWLREVIAGTESGLPHHWRPLDLDPLTRLVGPNIALLGDAAHPLLPFTSQGVNLALEDACLLRDLLRDAGDSAAIEAALRTYERQRLPLVRHYVAAGRGMAAAFLTFGPDHGLLPVAP